MKKNPFAKLQESQRQIVHEWLNGGPKTSDQIANALGIKHQRAVDILARLRKQGEVGRVTLAGSIRVWAMADQIATLQAEQNAIMRARELEASRQRRIRRVVLETGVDPEDLDRDDWPVKQSRVSRWAPIRPPVPVSIFTLGAA